MWSSFRTRRCFLPPPPLSSVESPAGKTERKIAKKEKMKKEASGENRATFSSGTYHHQVFLKKQIKLN